MTNNTFFVAVSNQMICIANPLMRTKIAVVLLLYLNILRIKKLDFPGN